MGWNLISFSSISLFSGCLLGPRNVGRGKKKTNDTREITVCSACVLLPLRRDSWKRTNAISHYYSINIMAQPSSTSGGLLIFYFVVAIGLSFHLAPKEQTESYHPEAKKTRKEEAVRGGRERFPREWSRVEGARPSPVCSQPSRAPVVPSFYRLKRNPFRYITAIASAPSFARLAA